MKYDVTAILEDNQENCVKVCTVVDNSFDAIDSVMAELCVKVDSGDDTALSVRRQIVTETWAIIYLSVMRRDE